MHGRVKVRTSEEEKIRKDRERQEKLKKFKQANAIIQLKKKQGELDKELLEITGNVLMSNPDIYTFWNIRREIIIIFRQTFDNLEELSKVHDDELQLTEYCLKINPKSYCAWHQRKWILTSRADPDWKKELSLCNKYLMLDERNFHTWDYRRFIVGQCKPPLKDEFDFTTEKLQENFSNYSAWHYRSKMLVDLYPDLIGGRPIKDSHHKNELKMVLSAAFTDPDDTSAWFYQRWLLGAVKTSISIVVSAVSPKKATVAFNSYVSYDFVKLTTHWFINQTVVNGVWMSCTGNEYDNVWIYKHNNKINDDLEVKVEYCSNENKQEILCEKVNNSVFYVGKGIINFQKQYSESVFEELKEQLKACRELLKLEPDSKWTLLTTTILLHCIDPKLYYKEAIENLILLKTTDKLRAGYYDDMISKWNIENQLYADYNNRECVDFKISFDVKITTLPRLQYYSFCQNVDLSNQMLTSKVLPSLVALQHCKKLLLANNKLTTLKQFPMLELEELNLQENESLIKEEIALLKEKYGFHIVF